MVWGIERLEKEREKERDCVWKREEDGCWEGGVREMGNWDKRRMRMSGIER